MGVQGDLARLRRNNSELKKMKKVLKKQLEKSQLWASKLETEVAELKSRIKKLGEQLEGTVPACQDSQTTQTDEEDIKEAAWLWQYGDSEQGEQDWKVSPGSPSLSDSEIPPGASLAEQVREAATSVLQQQGMVYEETSGLYYDYKSGHYFDAERSLYYDGNSGVYYSYDQEAGKYKVHSSMPEEEVTAQKILSQAARDAQEAKENRRKKRE